MSTADTFSAGPIALRYEIRQVIAHGESAIVYRASDREIGRDVAVKAPQEAHAAYPASVGRFIRQAEIVGQLEHPSIPPVHGLGLLPDGRPFIAMKLIRGRTLQDVLDEAPDPRADPGMRVFVRERLVAVFEQVCQGMGYAHFRGVLHRNLTPAHVMIDAFGEVRLIGWGRALVLEEGTKDFRADVLGLGEILCAILTGAPTAAGDVGGASARLDACGAAPELVALAKRCMGLTPGSQPTDATEVARLLSQCRKADEPRRRRRLRFALVAVGLLTLGVTVGLFLGVCLARALG
jgi:serine/threonine protein kinase